MRERKSNAERIKKQAEAALNLAPLRIQRIYRYRIIKRMKWDKVAEKMGGKCTGDSVRKEFENDFFQKNESLSDLSGLSGFSVVLCILTEM